MCGCADPREEYGLLLIFQIFMRSNQGVIQIQLLKDHDSLSCQSARVTNGEIHSRAACAVHTNGESARAADLIARSVEDRLTCCLIHQNALQCIGLTKLQVLIIDNIYNIDIAVCQQLLISVAVSGSRPDTRHIHRLLLVGKIFVLCNHFCAVADLFKSDQRDRRHIRRVERERNCNSTIVVLHGEFCMGNHFITVRVNRDSSGFLVHQLTGDGILCPDHKVFIYDIVRDRGFFNCVHDLGIIRAEQHSADLRNSNCLILVIQLLMLCDCSAAAVSDLFKYDQALPFQVRPVKFEADLNSAVRTTNLLYGFSCNGIPISVFGCQTSCRVLKRTAEGVGLALDQVAVCDPVNDFHLTTGKKLLGPAHAGGKGPNLREAHSLVLIFQIFVHSDLDAKLCQSLEGNEGLSFHTACVKLEADSRGAACSSRCEFSFRDNLITAGILRDLSGLLIHQMAAQSIALAGNQVFISNRIDNGHSAACSDLMVSIRISGNSSDLRDVHSLRLIRQIFVFCHNGSFAADAFKRNNCCILKCFRVKDELHNECAVCSLRRNCAFNCDSCAVRACNGHTGITVHQCSVHGISPASDQIMEFNCIKQMQLPVRKCDMGTIRSVQNCLDGRDCNRLIFIFNIRVFCNDTIIVIQLFEHDQCLAGNNRSIKRKGKLNASVLVCGGECSRSGDVISVHVFCRSAGGLVHQSAVYGISLARHQVFIGDSIDNRNGTGGSRRISIAGTGMCADCRECDGLILIIDILVVCDQFIFQVIERLEDNQGLPCQNLSVLNREAHRLRAVCGAYNDFFLTGDFRTGGILHHFSGGLIHQLTAQQVAARLQLTVLNRITDYNLAIGIEFTAAIQPGCGCLEAGHINGLVLILNILMFSDYSAVHCQFLKGDDSRPSNIISVELKGDIDCARRFRRHKRFLRSNGTGRSADRSLGCLIHESTNHSIGFARDQSFISDCIGQNHWIGCGSNM